MGIIFSNIYAEYIKASNRLKHTKNEEITLRNNIIDSCAKPKIAGTVNDILSGFKVKYGFKVNVKVDKAVLDVVWENLSQEEKNVIKFTPEIKSKEYKALKESNPNSALLKAITEKPGQASLDIEEIL